MSKLTADKKFLTTIIFGQCNDATRTEIALGATYKTDHQDGNIINFLKQLHTLYYGSVDGDLYLKPYKNVMLVKSLNNFSNTKPIDPYGFREDLKIKYNAVLAVVGKFPNGTGPMMELLKAETPLRSWAGYSAVDVADQAMWEERVDASTKAMLLY